MFTLRPVPTVLVASWLTSLAAGSPQLVAAETAQLRSVPQLASAQLGSAAALSGDTAVVGAPTEAAGGLAVAGAAYVFERDEGGAGAWGLTKRLVPSGAATGDRFGEAVSVDADTIVVGALTSDAAGFNAGAVYVFERDAGGPGTWGEVAVLLPAAPTSLMYFGQSVTVDADTIVVGVPRDDTGGATNAGVARVFERDAGGPGAWGEVAMLVASDPWSSGFFGRSVSLSGDTLAVGASRNGAGGMNAGAAYVFERNLGGAGAWGQTARLAPADLAALDNFGRALSLSGDFVVVGSHLDDDAGDASGAAYVFDRSESWGEVAKLTASDAAPQDAFGHSVSVDAALVVIGSINDADLGFESGSGYVFERGAAAADWSEVAKVLASDGAVRDRLGWSASVSGGTAVFGALRHDYGVDLIEGLAFDPATNTLWGASTGVDRLVRIDPVTGDVVAVGDFGFSDVTGLAFDPITKTLYGVDGTSDQLITIDTATGVGTAVGPLGKDNVEGLAFDPGSNTLYGSRVNPDRLITIDPATGAASAGGPNGVSSGMRGLAFDSTSGTLYGSDQFWLYSVETTTGAATAIGDTGFDRVRGLAPLMAGAVYGVDWGVDEVLSVDTGTGAASSLGLNTLLVDVGAAYVFELSSESATYCTAGVSASGCQASLTAAGTASASAPTGFVLTAAGVEGAKDGLFFFGTNGRQANAWGNGSSYQCVVPPVKRAGLLAGTGTTGSCDGTFAQSLNALWCPTCSKPGHNPGAGTYVQVQLWHRDPLNTSNRTTSLSNAVEALVGP